MLSEEDIWPLADKLAGWSATLPVKEQALLHLLLARAQGSTEGLSSAEGMTLPGVKATTISVLRPILQQLGHGRVDGWVEAGDPWVKGASLGIERGDPGP